MSGCVTPSGRWVSLGIAHRTLGRLWLTASERFPDHLRGDEDAVRQHRAALAAPDRPSFGLSLAEGDAVAFFVQSSLPLAVRETPELRVEITTVAPAARAGAVQLVRIQAGARAIRLAPEWTGQPRLGRADYTQITEGGAMPHPPVAPRHGRDGPLVWFEDAALEGAAAFVLPDTIELAAGDSAELALGVAIGFSLDDVVAEARSLQRDARALLDADVAARRSFWSGVGGAEDDPAARPVAYALDCAASRVSAREVAVITDHEILPLVWTRDAYYICRALLAFAPNDARVRDTIDGFVRWLFEVAERPDGAWPRASLASGQAKDVAFQLDQQLYPALLLADHARLTGDRAVRARYEHDCAEVLDGLLRRREKFGLVATAENPADDPLRQPFHFSSHVLFWHVLECFGHRAAGEIRDAALEHFASDGRFAYAVRGARGADAWHYHDANDLPLVFAPGWGFCAADDPRWRATVAFAWSDANEGYFAGPFGGLGSLHTPRPWTLGDLQEIVVARVIGDRARESRARERLARVETWDHLLAEAYDQSNGAVAARHWFAWPGAVRAMLERDRMLTAP